MSKTLDRITIQAYAAPQGGQAIEYSVDREPVSMSNPLQLDGSLVPFYYEQPVLRPLDGPVKTSTRECWISYEVLEFHTGTIHYASNADEADRLAYQIAQAYLLGILVNGGTLP
jgi:hypothetical protein